ncbi:MAG: hypothetical protein ACRCWY_02995 [Cellulosilyticaceae bacterium]
MSNLQTASQSIYLTIDCEFTEEGLVRELALLLFKDNQIVRALEVLISTSGDPKAHYNHLQTNYHLASADELNTCIDGFLKSCAIYAPLEELKLVGMSLEHDLKSILNTTNRKSLLSKITQKTQLEMCGRGTLENKATTHQISSHQIDKVLDRLVSPKNKGTYKYHTALYDAIVTGYVYLRVIGTKDLMGVHPRFKKCRHTYFKSYYKDLAQLTVSKKQLSKKQSPAQRKANSATTQASKIPKNFPEIRYKAQKKLSNVFDIVAREMFHRHLSKLYYEPSLKKIDLIKQDILEQLHPVKLAVAAYDTTTPLTDPYNHSLVDAGVLLVHGKISIEDFVDFAIYMQQYNLPSNKGHYYKVSNAKRELYVRCLQRSTASKLLYKHPYCTIEQFLRKKVNECELEQLD